MPEIKVPVTICGLDLTATIDYDVTYRGRPGFHNEAAEGMEFAVEVTELFGEPDGYPELPGWLAQAILNQYDDSIYHAIKENEGS
jgi:hypothetical protein